MRASPAESEKVRREISCGIGEESGRSGADSKHLCVMRNRKQREERGTANETAPHVGFRVDFPLCSAEASKAVEPQGRGFIRIFDGKFVLIVDGEESAGQRFPILLRDRIAKFDDPATTFPGLETKFSLTAFTFFDFHDAVAFVVTVVVIVVPMIAIVIALAFGIVWVFGNLAWAGDWGGL